MLGESLAARSGLSGGDLDEHVQQATREIVLAVIALPELFGDQVGLRVEPGPAVGRRGPLRAEDRSRRHQ